MLPGPDNQASLFTSEWREREKLLDRFDRTWKSGTPPRIEDFLQAAAKGGVGTDSAQRELLVELVTIDLQYRWRVKTGGPRVGQEQPRLEDYVARFPDLGPLTRLPADLIGEEYRVRQRWGDHPSHAEFAARFPQHGSKLLETLTALDTELAGEFVPKGRTTPAANPPPSQAAVTAATLLAEVRKHQLVNLAQLNELKGADLSGRFAEARSLAQEFLRRNWLTPYQANQLLQGRGADLELGPYLLLERLGEGGVGQVFKARHRKMARMAAVKLIRKELLTDPEVVGRFFREIEVVSRLDHPNVVHAYDAGPTAASHFLAMEYVEGTDLARLVKQGGPLPVEQACEYIRQAALGLQHAHEKGLVHRDIKPHNLILSVRDGLIKVADLGLARLQCSGNAEVTAVLNYQNAAGSLTPVGAVMMGTADYLAPEQALNFHQADIRADIYSLGCTFWFLLTGRPPFAGGNLAEKVARHMHAEPPAVATVRSDVPPGINPVLAKMLAKKVEDRYQAPAEVADALRPFSSASLTKGSPAAGQARIASRDGRPIGGRSLGRPPHRRPGARLVVGLVLAGALAFALIRSFQSEPGKQPNDTAATADESAKVAWLALRAKADNLDPGQLRQQLLALRTAYPGSEAAVQAGEWLRRLPSPLDRLDPNLIPPRLRADLPKEMVAVLGEPGNPGEADYGNVVFRPDGLMLAVSGPGQALEIWDLDKSPKPQRVALPESTVIVMALSSSPNGKYLAAAGKDGTVRIRQWEGVESRNPTVLSASSKALLALAYSPDGRWLATGGEDGYVRVWQTAEATLREVEKLRMNQAAMEALTFSADGKTLITGGQDYTIRLWKQTEGKLQQPLVSQRLNHHVEGMAIPPDPGTRLIAFNKNGPFQVCETVAENVKKMRTILTKAQGAAFAPDGKTWASTENGDQVVIRDVFTDQRLRGWALPREVNGLAFAPDGRHLAIANRNGVVYVLRLAGPPAQ